MLHGCECQLYGRWKGLHKWDHIKLAHDMRSKSICCFYKEISLCRKVPLEDISFIRLIHIFIEKKTSKKSTARGLEPSLRRVHEGLKDIRQSSKWQT